MLYSLFEVVIFLFCIVFCFYLPGKFLLSVFRLKVLPYEELFIAPVFGILALTFFFYLLSWIHAEWLIIPLILGADFGILRQRKLFSFAFGRKHWWSFVFILGSGILFSFPLLLWGIYGQTIKYGFDDLWHLSLIQELKVHFPPDVPTFAGVRLSGYHFFYNFLLAKISNLLFLSPFSLHFHFFPVLLALLWGLGVYVFLLAWSKKMSAAIFGVFLTMFGGSFAYILHWQGHPEVNLGDGLGILQPAGSVYNPPFTFSIVILVFALFVLYQYFQTRKKQWLVPFVLAAGLLPMFKVYAGIVLFGGFAFLVFCELLRKRFFILVPSVFIGIIFLTTYGIFVGRSGGLLWHPFWPPHELLRGFHWYGYDEKIYTFSRLHVYRGLVETEFYGFSLFLIWNLGTRILGLVSLPLFILKKRKAPSLFAFALLVMLFISILLPLLFLQTGKVFEIIQTASYYLFFCSLFASLGLAKFWSLRFRFRKIVMPVLLVLFAALTVPSAFMVYHSDIVEAKNRTDLTQPYYEALSFLRNRGDYDQTVLELPSSHISSQLTDISYWYKYSSPIVSAFADKRAYLGSTGIAFPGMKEDVRERDLSLLLSFREHPSVVLQNQVAVFLRAHYIVYIFSPSAVPALLHIQGMKEIYHLGYYIYEFNSV